MLKKALQLFLLLTTATTILFVFLGHVLMPADNPSTIPGSNQNLFSYNQTPPELSPYKPKTYASLYEECEEISDKDETGREKNLMSPKEGIDPKSMVDRYRKQQPANEPQPGCRFLPIEFYKISPDVLVAKYGVTASDIGYYEYHRYNVSVDSYEILDKSKDSAYAPYDSLSPDGRFLLFIELTPPHDKAIDSYLGTYIEKISTNQHYPTSWDIPPSNVTYVIHDILTNTEVARKKFDTPLVTYSSELAEGFYVRCEWDLEGRKLSLYNPYEDPATKANASIIDF